TGLSGGPLGAFVRSGRLAGPGGRATVFRAAPRRARGSEGAAERAHRTNPGADPWPRGEQIAGKAREIELINQELEGVRELWRKNLIPIARLMALERDAARLRGERGALVAAIAQARGKITETTASDLVDRSGPSQRGEQGAGRDPGKDLGADR